MFHFVIVCMRIIIGTSLCERDSSRVRARLHRMGNVCQLLAAVAAAAARLPFFLLWAQIYLNELRTHWLNLSLCLRLWCACVCVWECLLSFRAKLAVFVLQQQTLEAYNIAHEIRTTNAPACECIIHNCWTAHDAMMTTMTMATSVATSRTEIIPITNNRTKSRNWSNHVRWKR